jgi:hypothetical protein
MDKRKSNWLKINKLKINYLRSTLELIQATFSLFSLKINKNKSRELG